MAAIEVTMPAVNVATIQAWAGSEAAVAASLHAAMGAPAPLGPKAVTGKGHTAVGWGPQSWLVVEEPAASRWPERIVEDFGSQAAACDQTGGYVLWRLSGDRAHDLMAKGAFLDVDPAHFQVGDAANTVIAHMGVTLWKSGQNAFDILVFRSYEKAFAHWLEVAAKGLDR